MESSTKGGSGSSTSQLTPAFPTSGMTSFSQSLQSQSQSHPMRDSMGNTPDIIDYNVAVVADDLTNIHDALVSEKKIVSEKTMEDLRFVLFAFLSKKNIAGAGRKTVACIRLVLQDLTLYNVPLSHLGNVFKNILKQKCSESNL